MIINPLMAIDFYKTDHRRQYPEGTTEVYSNFTARSDRLAKVVRETFDHKVVFFGLQFFIIDFLMDMWNDNFFKKPKEEVLAVYQRRMDCSLGKGAIDTTHIAALHDLGYLPLKIKALPEGMRVPIGVPMLTVINTHPDFFWVTNYIETVISNYLWKTITSATTAFEYKKLFKLYAIKTGSPREFIQFQVHDFSFRGTSGLQDAAMTGAAHLTSFWGTDSVPAIDLIEDYYNADATHEMIGCSVPATEHSVMCMGMEEGELATFRRLITELYPTGVVSIVSDTWDFWRVVTQYLRELKAEIMQRDGKIVIRPDSGDPVNIIAGDPDAPAGSPECKGTIECLWDIFGGTITEQGYKLLDAHIGLIYGDSITLERAHHILTALERKGFASGNVVFGVGSFTYQYVTRDNFGFAMKATSGVVNGKRRDIFKDPKTDAGIKKSARGLLRVERQGDDIVLLDQQTEAEENQGLLEAVFLDGKLMRNVSFAEIRNRIDVEL
ncbi:MAG: nicotinate phosphoribosyltransferase [Pseudomonadota bacterium]|nr:nicotinate phosphoribosyltransferase [Pseudomonadota bacterium]